jgi:hypothetical protein
MGKGEGELSRKVFGLFLQLIFSHSRSVRSADSRFICPTFCRYIIYRISLAEN